MVAPRIKGNEPEQPIVPVVPVVVIPPTEPPKEPDWKALAEKHEAEVKRQADELGKRDQQIAGLRGTAQQKLDYEAETARMRRELQRNNDMLAGMLERAGDTEAQAAYAKQVRQDIQTQDAMDARAVEARDAWADLQEEVRDAGFDLNKLNTEPALEGVRQAWNRGFGVNGQILDTRSMREAVRVARGLRRDTQSARLERERLEREEAKKEEARNAPAANAAPADAAPGPRGIQNADDLRDAWLTKRITRDEYTRLKQQFGA